MTRHFPRPDPRATAHATIVVDAVRCRGDARDAGRPTLPSLSHMLDAHDCAILTPVLDSLIHFYEIALGRAVRTGDALGLSADEQQLLGLLDGGLSRAASLDCGHDMAAAFDCAICSTRIMLALTLPAAPVRHIHYAVPQAQAVL